VVLGFEVVSTALKLVPAGYCCLLALELPFLQSWAAHNIHCWGPLAIVPLQDQVACACGGRGRRYPE
jgi:hypothetical protein